MNDHHKAIFLTGATGLIGRQLLHELQVRFPGASIIALVRSPERWASFSALADSITAGVTPVMGDVAEPGLALSAQERASLAKRVTAIVHCAADVRFSQPLADARRVNTEGTRHVLEIAEEWPSVQRVAYVSTAFVAGTRTGVIKEDSAVVPSGWVNAYEQSKYEAEQHVRSCTRSWVILRPTTIACESGSGNVRQINSLHRSLALLRAGLAPMLPGREDAPIDLTTTQYVAQAIASIALRPDAANRTFHLCAGKGALTLGEVLDRSLARWSREPDWLRRGVSRPSLTDIDTYRLFEESVEETADARLRSVTRSLSHFVPQLALPKVFDTSATDAMLGFAAPDVLSFWPAMLDHLATARLQRTLRSAA